MRRVQIWWFGRGHTMSNDPYDIWEWIGAPDRWMKRALVRRLQRDIDLWYEIRVIHST